jgi:hypothetical protein
MRNVEKNWPKTVKEISSIALLGFLLIDCSIDITPAIVIGFLPIYRMKYGKIVSQIKLYF